MMFYWYSSLFFYSETDTIDLMLPSLDPQSYYESWIWSYQSLDYMRIAFL